MKNTTVKYILVFSFLFVIFLLGEFVFKLVFYPETPYWKSLLFVAIASIMMTYIVFKRGEINSLRDIIKYKKKTIKLNDKLTIQQVNLICEMLKLNRYILNEERSSPTNIKFSSKFNLFDFGDFFSIKFSEKEVIIQSRPKAIVNITDPNRLTAKRMGQIEQIIHYITQNKNIKTQ